MIKQFYFPIMLLIALWSSYEILNIFSPSSVLDITIVAMVFNIAGYIEGRTEI